MPVLRLAAAGRGWRDGCGRDRLPEPSL